MGQRRNAKAVILYEGRDASGKTTSIRETFARLEKEGLSARIIKLGRPSDEERAGFWFERFQLALESASAKDTDVVLFDRSWYVRPTVERVMGFCSPREIEQFFESVKRVEADLVKGGRRLLKLFLTVDERTQRRRLEARRERSAIDACALERATDYARAEADVFVRAAPWVVGPASEVWGHVREQLRLGGRPP